MKKTKVMKYKLSSGHNEDCGKWPCGVCWKGVGANSLVCGSCKKWIYKKCSGNLTADVSFHCSVCIGGRMSGLKLEQKVLLDDSGSLDSVDKFCYLRDM